MALYHKFTLFSTNKKKAEQIEFYLCHKDCSDELPVLDCQPDDEGEAKYYIWAKWQKKMLCRKKQSIRKN